MIKKFITILFAFFFFIFIFNKFPHPVQGQVDQVGQAPAAQLWRCLKAEQAGQKDRKPPPEVDVVLSGVGFPSLQDIYIVLCVPPVTATKESPKNYKCSTGNSASDWDIFGSDLTKKIDFLSFEVPKGTSPPHTVQASYGKLDLVAHMNGIQGHVSYAYFGVTLNEPKLVSEARADTIQYATFQFEQDPAKCVSIRWDPFGRVFDSQSLEPIRGVKIRLLHGDATNLNTYKQLVVPKKIGLVNPQTTEADGLFNFFVHIREGGIKMFILDPLPLPPLTHSFIATPNLHPNYVKAYSDIYKPGEIISEAAGVPEHRDIPLDPGIDPATNLPNPPFRSDPVSMSAASVKIGQSTRYEGTVSHPLSKVTLVGQNTGNLVARTEADKNGFWEILVPNANIPPNEALIPEINKVDLTTLARTSPNNSLAKSAYEFFLRFIRAALPKLNNKVSAQDAGSNAGFQPILTYVEGYAYDQSGKIVTNATVKVKLEMSDGLYYQTTADANGFFSISPENLPIFNYYLEFDSRSTGSIRMTTSEFVEKNQNHLSTNNVNLMTATKKGQSLLPATQGSPTPEVKVSPGSNQTLLAGNKLNLILTVIALVVLLGVAGGVLLYIKKKQSQTDSLL